MCQITEKKYSPRDRGLHYLVIKKREMNVALTGLKEAGARLVCLSPNTNFLSDTVHFCYPCPQPEKKLHHFSSPLCHLRTRSVPLVPPSMLHVGFAYSSETSQRGPQDRTAFTDFHQTKGSSHRSVESRGAGADRPLRFERSELPYKSCHRGLHTPLASLMGLQ